MREYKSRKLLLFFCLLIMSFIILNAREATAGAKAGIELCLYTVVPALFPYCMLAIWLRSISYNKHLKIFLPLEKMCNMPQGSSIFLILGLLGGYPMGTICVEQAIKSKSYQRKQLKYMSGICNNAGPSFLLGIISFYFSDNNYVIILMIIQAFSALITCTALSYYEDIPFHITKENPSKFSDAIRNAIISISNICATVILFKTLLATINKYIRLPRNSGLYIIVVGFFELTNGASLLGEINNENLRFIISAGIISFGGLCVHMQSMLMSASGTYKNYITAVIIKTVICILLSILYVQTQSVFIMIVTVISSIVIVKTIKSIIYKKGVAIKKKIVYNSPIS